MKRQEAFKSAYLGKDDVPQPIIRTIADVFTDMVNGEKREEERPIMRFAEPDTKAMILNNVNWDTCERAYGVESNAWVGKPVEIYIDPNVEFKGRRLGGLRLRIPAVATQPSNGDVFATFADAVREAGKFEITPDQIRAVVKANGGSSWVPLRDSKLVRAMIAELANNMDAPDNIPF